jgi:hypothetical protein
MQVSGVMACLWRCRGDSAVPDLRASLSAQCFRVLTLSSLLIPREHVSTEDLWNLKGT